jgi:hypothetical protein
MRVLLIVLFILSTPLLTSASNSDSRINCKPTSIQVLDSGFDLNKAIKSPRSAQVNNQISVKPSVEVPKIPLMASQQPTWVPVPNMQFNMNVIGKIQISTGVYSLNENDLIGAFVGNECRGVTSPVPSLAGILFLTIGSNIQSGETVTFKIYLASTNEIANTNETIAFQNAGEVGTMTNPYIFTYISSACNLSVISTNQNAPSAPAGSSIYSISSNCDWTAVSNQTWCSVTASGNGNGTITANYSINSTSSIRIANITINVSGSSPVVVTLTQAGAFVAPSWTTTPNLQFNMNVIGKIQISANTYSLNENDVIGAFVGDECRGTAHPFTSLGGILFLTIGSNIQTEIITFKIYRASTNEIIDADQIITFQNAGEIGTMANPFIFTFGYACSLSVSPSVQNVPSTPAGSTTFLLTTLCNWSAVSSQAWCSVTSSGLGNSTLLANYSTNPNTTARTATITVTIAGSSPVTVSLIQAGTSDRVLNMTLFLEGLISNNIMTKTQGVLANQFPGTIADVMTVELHSSTSPYTKVGPGYTAALNIDGTGTIFIPSEFSGSYYVVFKNRNHIETWTANPISFAGTAVNINLSQSLSSAYGNNLKLIGSKYCIYAGDVNQDGYVNTLDQNQTDIKSSLFGTDYIPEDTNGDGITDALDLILIDNNASHFVGIKAP